MVHSRIKKKRNEVVINYHFTTVSFTTVSFTTVSNVELLNEREVIGVIL